MSLFCQSDEMLHYFTDLLHDLWFDWPNEGWKVQDGMLSFILRDTENLLDKERTIAFRLTIRAVEDVRVTGRPAELPGSEEFNEFDYRKSEGLLILKNCLATEIHCKVKELHLELDQLPG